ncbi:gluzincin family metallopeptidase [Changchengzhania lutea]|uniref:serine protease n=1 Tax=Changchengzhania lutea TaxID=2049305 RepID=UPI00115DFCEA|nr:serine protease [Changchengzhania lutea]
MEQKNKLKKITKKDLYSIKDLMKSESQRDLGLQIPFDVYLQDPYVANEDPLFGFVDNFYIPWEPNISDGPTSARFAVVDYSSETGILTDKALWDEAQLKFRNSDGVVLDRNTKDLFQFHQVNVWAILQRALRYFEHGDGLGRPIPFAFEGNKLIVVPHAGYGKNAFYDRQSKSLQFYYFVENNKTVYTCLSTDIINHEFGHAILDGIRPHFINSVLPQTGAFHEFVGDITALLIIFSNNNFRNRLGYLTDGNLDDPLGSAFQSIADEFGKATHHRPYLRSANNKKTMHDVKDSLSPHSISEVLTGAVFDILKKLIDQYKERGHTTAKAMAYASRMIRRICIQPLDLLPPVDGTFKDYALACLKAFQISNPIDPNHYYDIIKSVFKDRKILTAKDIREHERNPYTHEELTLEIHHDIGRIARSRAAAYDFLNDNRKALFIPRHQNLIVSDLYDSNKFSRSGLKLPRQIILEYIWKEEHILNHWRYEEFNNEKIEILCGGTLVFDQNGTVISWFRKPGTTLEHEIEKPKKNQIEEFEDGKLRKKELLSALSKRIQRGAIGMSLGGEIGLLESHISSLQVTRANGTLKFGIAPHINLDCKDGTKNYNTWEISS